MCLIDAHDDSLSDAGSYAGPVETFVPLDFVEQTAGHCLRMEEHAKRTWLEIGAEVLCTLGRLHPDNGIDDRQVDIRSDYLIAVSRNVGLTARGR